MENIFLKGVNPAEVVRKFNLSEDNFLGNTNIPKNTTKIDELEIIKNIPDVVCFLDESKRTKRCTISHIDFSVKKDYRCFWDKNPLPIGVCPIGCPIRFVSDKAVKTYHSEISKDVYSISENVIPDRFRELKQRKDDRFSLTEGKYYETDGIFCSPNCVLAWINSPENKNDPKYRYSATLTLRMFRDLMNLEEIPQIIPAPHWRTLKEFGGNLSIEKFRESFNKIRFEENGYLACKSILYLFEPKVKL